MNRLSEALVDALRLRLEGIAAVDRYGETAILNIYYDTPENLLIRRSIEKPYYKEKLRLRSYYSPAAPDSSVFLEVKKKIGGIVAKRLAAQ